MNRIHTIKLKNFKAFESPEQIVLAGKHLLLYGENGSGKSSIYWALYTLLQGTIPGKGTGKYFTRGDRESLLNAFTTDDDSYIAITFSDNPAMEHRLDINGLTPSPAVDPTLGETNLSSDFISHRLLFNFYNFRNSQEINLFPVFVRDILPYRQTAAGKNLLGLYNEIQSERPFKTSSRSTNIINDRGKGRKSYLSKISILNSEIDKIVADINLDATNFYSAHFDNDANNFDIKVEYTRKLAYGEVTEIRRVGGSPSGTYTAKGLMQLNNPEIRLIVKQRVGVAFVDISKPQSFLNEAKLTGIALSIRLSLLARRASVPTRVLGLDDLLVSLDMTNRESVLNTILAEFAPTFQLLLLTHDKGFFRFAKTKFARVLPNDFVAYEMYVDVSGPHEKPVIQTSETNIERAKRYFTSSPRDYSAAANCLRSDAEEFLKEFLPRNYQYNEHHVALDLSGLIGKSIRYASENDLESSAFQSLNDCRMYIFNPGSHDDIDATLFRTELDKAFTTLGKLHQYKFDTILSPGSKLSFQLTSGADSHSLQLELRRDLRLLQEPGKLSKLARCKFWMIWNKNGIKLRENRKQDSLVTLYASVCKILGVVPNTDIFQVYTLPSGALLQTLRKY